MDKSQKRVCLQSCAGQIEHAIRQSERNLIAINELMQLQNKQHYALTTARQFVEHLIQQENAYLSKEVVHE